MKHLNRIFILLVMVLITVSVGKAQTILTGKIYDKTTRQGLAGANVYFPEIKSGTVANLNGEYEGKVPSKKRIKVQFSYMGYQTVLKTLFTDSSHCQLNIAIEPLPIESEEVVVSGIMPSTQHENAIKIETVKAQEIETSGSPNLIETLASIPGVNMISKSPGVSMPVIRGLSMTNIIVMNNGVKLENYHYSKDHAFIIDEFGVEQVEVIKGPASLLYGSGAVGGVINFIKEKPAFLDGIEGDYTAHYHSNTIGFCNSLGIKGKKNDFNWGLRGGYKTNADYLDGNGDFVPNTRFNDKSFKANVGLVKPFGNFNLYYDYSRPQLGMCKESVLPLETERGRKLKWWYQDLTSHIISSRNKLFLGEYKFDINISYQINDRKGWTDTTSTKGYNLVDATMGTLGYECKMHLPSSEKTEYIIGIQGENRTNRNHDAPVQVIPDADVNDFSLFGFAQYYIGEWIKAQGGIRYDYNYTSTCSRANSEAIKRSFNNVSYSVGATYTISDTWLTRLNVASAYRTPNLGELTQDGWHGTRYEQGDPSLKAQRNIEVDWNLQYHSDKLMTEVSVFYNHVNNYIYMSPTNDTTAEGAKIYRHSQDNATLYGGEFTCAYAPVPAVKLQAAYSYLHAEKENGDYLPYIPPGELTVSAKLKKDRLLFLRNTYMKVGIDWAAKQDKPSLFETETASYCLFNLGFGAQAKWGNETIDFGLFVNNLFNKTYYDHLSTLKDLGFYNIGRNISFLIKIPFKIKTKS